MVTTEPGPRVLNDWSELTRLTVKNLLSSASVILRPSTSTPVRRIASRVSTSGVNPILSIAKFEHGVFFNLAGFRPAGTGTGLPNSTADFAAGIVTRACPGPPLSVTLKLQLVRLPLASVAMQATVVTPTAKVEPDAGTQV